MKINQLLLPIITLSSSVLLNTDRYIDPSLKTYMHVFLQALLIYGLIVLFRKKLLVRIFISLFITISIFTQLAYGAPISVSILMSILNSSTTESVSFIEFNFFILLASLMIFLGLIFSSCPRKSSINSAILTIGLAYLIAPSLTSDQLFSSSNYTNYLKTGLARGHSESLTSIEYVVENLSLRFTPLTSFRAISDSVSVLLYQEKLISSWTEVSSYNSSDLLVIGIGESLRANNLGIYGYKRNTTPNLSKLSSALTIYNYSYAAGTNTWSSIPAALTKVGVKPDLSKSIINLAKDAGYETYWLSNQTKYSQWDFSVTSIAEQADHTFFSSDETDSLETDLVLVTKLQEILISLKSPKKRLIVLNYYGSHMTFTDRYPIEYSHFNGENLLLDQYDNSVLYTDFIQSEVINIVAKYGGKYLFFADHGLGDPKGDIPLMHDVRNNPDIDSIKVPFFLYPKNTMSIKANATISLYYFECIFSQWAKISAAELRNGYCSNALDKKEISFLDSNLILHEVSLPD